MKNSIKYIAILAATILSAGACSKWTQQEALEFNYVTIGEKNPALYEAYLESVRSYHATEHQVLIARFDNKAGVLSGRADHVNNLPDSVDYVVLNNYTAINETILSEVNEVRSMKGTKTLIPLDFDALVKEYALYVEGLESETEPTFEDEIAWMGDKVNAFIGTATKLNLDGVLVSYVGKNPLGLKSGESEKVIALQEAFFGPVLTYAASGKLLFFQGNPNHLLLEADVLTPAKYIIVPAESVTSTEGFNFAVHMASGNNIPADKFVLGVTAFDVTDETATNGLFNGGISAIEGAARWAVAPDANFGKLGICVNHAQFDYYNIQHVYREISTAIATMNPSPLK